MSHSLARIWIHGVFGTKDHAPMIRPEHEHQLHAHMREHLERDLGCGVRSIDGTTDHIHVLFLLSVNSSISDVFKNVEGESSHWWNQNKFTEAPFAWQTGYGAFSVSESRVSDVGRYIANQKEHHREVSFQKEVELLIEKYHLAEAKNR